MARARNLPSAPGLEARCHASNARRAENRVLNAQPLERYAPVKVLGGKPSDSASPSTLSICEAAAMARARNSPEASGLEARCLASQPQPAEPAVEPELNLDALPPAEPEPMADEPPPEGKGSRRQKTNRTGEET